jgi:predicted dehydrogenase
MKIGVIGLGYWGPNLVRNFLSHNDVKKVIACDIRENRLQVIKEKFPAAELSKDYNNLIEGDSDIIVIATPVDTHHSLAKKSLEAGKHIWVEKPFTSTSAEAEELIEIAEKKNLNIFVDHTFIYNGAVRKIKELLGLFQRDVNVVWDLAPHDLSIMTYLLENRKVKALAANGIANFNGKENLAHICIYFEDNCFAHFHVNWVSPVKIRRIIIGGDKKMLVYDDMENFEKIKVYDSGVEFNSAEKIHEALVQYRIGDMFSPKVNQTEALALGAQEFIAAIKESRTPLTSGKDGLAVVRLLEAADISLSNMGKIIEFDSMLVE